MIDKVSHCQDCPSKSAPGRCIGRGSFPSDVLFLGGAPKEGVVDANFKAFSDSTGSFFENFLESLKKEKPEFKNLKSFFSHAVQCVAEKEDAETLKHCRSLIRGEIARVQPTVVVALGAYAMKALGITTTVDAARGKLVEMEVGGHRFHCLPTYAPGALLRKENTGLAPSFKQDIVRALRTALGYTAAASPIEDQVKGYRICTTVAQGVALCQEILDYRNPKTGKDEDVVLAVDTETTSNHPIGGLATWDPSFRILAISFAWGEGLAGAILLNHREMKEDWQEIVPWIQRVLTSPKRKTFHNWKYDFRVLELAMKWEVKSVFWDSMLVEYLLDEGRQKYRLEEVTAQRVPEFSDYKSRFKLKMQMVSAADDYEAGAADHKKLLAELKTYRQARKEAEGKDKKKELALKIVELADKVELSKEVLVDLKDRAKQEKTENKKVDFERPAAVDMLTYAACDADCTWRNTKQQAADLYAEDKDLLAALRIIMLPASKTLGRMEHEGVKVDMTYLTQLENEFDAIIEKERAKIYEIAGEEFELNSPQQVVNILVGKLGLKLTQLTKKGQTSVNKDALKEVAKLHPIGNHMLNYRKAYTARNNQLMGIRKSAEVDGRVHASYNQTATATGRLCLAKGTMIEVVRDVSKNPKGMPIEDVKPGDYVYCYDDDLNLRLKKVLWQGKTGHKKVIRVHWQSRGHRTGFVDLTPEHKVRLIDGTYVEARKLAPKDRVMSLSRMLHKARPVLMSRSEKMEEHTFIFKELNPDKKFEVVHHVNENTQDNTPSNLLGLSAAEHNRIHATKRGAMPEAKEALSARVKNLWREGRITHKTGEESPNWVEVSKFTLLRELSRNGGVASRCRASVKSWETFRYKCQLRGIYLKEVFKRYDATGKYISKGRLKRSLAFDYPERFKQCRVSYRRHKELCNLRGIEIPAPKRNHVIRKIEEVETAVDVYDLEVEGCHNFIANEVCVHNSSSNPNLQNVPARGILGKNIKKLFIPDSDDEVFVNFDYTGAELRVLCVYAKDQNLIKTLGGGLNMHSFVASEVFDLDYDEIQKREELYKDKDPEKHERYMLLELRRQTSKAMVFLTIFGGGAHKLFENLVKDGAKVTLEDCEGYINKFLDRFPVIRTYMQQIKREVDRKGKVKTVFGRLRRFPLASLSFSQRNAAHREGINFPVQSTSSDLVLDRLVEIDEKREELGLKLRFTVHDSVAFSMPKSKLDLVRPFLDKYAEDRIMEKYAWMPIPFAYEAGWGPSYGECKNKIK